MFVIVVAADLSTVSIYYIRDTSDSARVVANSGGIHDIFHPRAVVQEHL